MRTLSRYLWREIIAASAFVLVALLALFAFFELINQLEDVGRGGYQMQHALMFVGLSIPARAYELMPIAALIGTVYALSKLAANSEFTIMRVSGMSTWRLATAVLTVGLGFVALTYAFGEVVAPPAERLAQTIRLAATGTSKAQEFRSGAWVRDVVRAADGSVERLRFVNVRQVRSDASAEGWRIYEFDRDFRLLSISTAQTGSYLTGQGWMLRDVIETRLPPVASAAAAGAVPRTSIVREAQRVWSSELTPEIFGVVLVQPERMGIVTLTQYIRHLTDNRQRTDRYEIAFWNKLLYPIAVLVMMALALPFAYLHVRAGSVSLKIFSGVMIGVLFYMLNKLFSHLGLLNNLPPVAVAALPSVVMLLVAMASLYWIERR
jgi:lipopolysaccharide export system permease protein